MTNAASTFMRYHFVYVLSFLDADEMSELIQQHQVVVIGHLQLFRTTTFCLQINSYQVIISKKHRISILQDEYPVIQGPTIYPAAVLDGVSRYARAPYRLNN